MKLAYNHIGTKKTINYVIFGLIFTLFSLSAKAQENPPIPIEVLVRNAQGLNFGAFVVGSAGGTISIEPFLGPPTHSLDVFPLSFSSQVHYAIFDVYANPGTLIQILQPQDVQLSGPSGSNVVLSINPSNQTSTGDSFIVKQNPQPVFVGGTLTLPAGASPAGQYNGSFTLTFIQE
jgi:hypothetical protein